VSEESWHRTRLIPESGINDVDEQGRRATSALLSVMGTVHELAAADQDWVLAELIRYLGQPRSEVTEFLQMGDSWDAVRGAVVASTLDRADPGALEVTGRFAELLRYAELGLRRDLGVDVVPEPAGHASPDFRRGGDQAGDLLIMDGILTGTIRVPGAIGPIVVTADLRAGTLVGHVDIDAPREGRATSRVNWMVRQLRQAPEATRVEAFAFASYARGSSASETLKAIRADPTLLITDPAKELRGFRVALDQPLGTAQGRGRGTFVDSVLSAILEFHSGVVQGLKAWSPPPSPVTGHYASLSIDVDAAESAISMSRSVSVDPPTRVAPMHPSRREMRLARPLDPGAGTEARSTPGWYQDPYDDRQLRWYDGSAWSERTYPGQPALA